jgi:hypothetical protein
VNASAQLAVHVVPTGRHGLVRIITENVGPEMLSPEEMVRTLRTAADQLEARHREGKTHGS